MPRDYFETLYAQEPDPWGFATSDYERRKYAATLEAIGGGHGAALEIGCSIGVFTQLLAGRCVRLLAVDIAGRPLEAARLRCAGLDHVTFRRMQVPEELPEQHFDLIVLSETGYYWSPVQLDGFIAWLKRSLVPGGMLALVHWTGETDYPLTGDAVHDRILAGTAGHLHRTRGVRGDSYRLDILMGGRAQPAAGQSAIASS
jgi:cyclopropane fatty-acyl-phospholipid synthase-like methyltransferase